MSERKVSLRVAATGGDRLKAELRSIGKEGQHALQLLESGGPAASRGLDATSAAAEDLMRRLTTLSMQAANAAASMGTVGSAGVGAQERINAGFRAAHGVSRSDDDIQAYGRALDDMRAKFSPVFAEMQRHRDAIKEIDNAARVGAINLDEWVAATNREEAANEKAAHSIRMRQAAFENFVNTGLRDFIDAQNGVTGELARTAADIEAYGRALDDTRAKYNPLFAEERRHAESLADIDRSLKTGAINMAEWEAATKREIAANEQASASIRMRQAAFENFVNTGLRDFIDAQNGVTGELARTAADIEAYGRALDDMRAKYNPLFAEERRHAEALAEIDRAHASGAIALDEWVAATKREVGANQQAAASIRARQAAIDNFVNTGLRDFIDAQAGITGERARMEEDIDAYGRALDDMRAKFNPLFAEERRHKDALFAIDQAQRVGAITIEEWVDATRHEEAANERAIASIRARQAAMESLVDVTLRNAIDAQNGVTGDAARTAADMEAFGRAMDEARARFSPLYAEQRRHNEAMEEMSRLARAGVLAEDEFVAATKREAAAHEQATAAIRARQIALENLVNTSLRDTIDQNLGIGAAPARESADIEAYGRALDATRAKYNPMFAAISRYRAQLGEIKAAHHAGALSADEMAAAISRARQASLHDIGVIKGRIKGYEAMEKQGGLARFQLVQLGYQLNDIGVSLASGQNPFIVMIQQGAQIAQIYGGQGGVRAMFSQIGSLIIGLPGPLKAAAVGVGVLGVAIKGMQHEILKTTDVAVSFGDTALAVWQVVSEGIWNWIKPAVDMIGPWFSAAWDIVVAGVKWTGNAIAKAFSFVVASVAAIPGVVGEEFDRIVRIGSAAYTGIVGVWGALPGAIGEFAYGAANALIGGVESMLNAVIVKINEFITGINSALSSLPEWATGGSKVAIGTLSTVSFGRVANPYSGSQDAAAAALGQAASDIAAAASGANAAYDDYKARMSDIWNSDPMGDFFDQVRAKAIDNAKKRLAQEGGGGAGKKEDEELAFLDKIITALEDYAKAAMDFGTQIGDAMVGAFKSAEDALVEFVTNGKLDIKSLVTSIIADFARIGIRGYIMGPLAQALAGAVGGNFGTMLTKAFVQHTGGGAGSGAMRTISAANFVNAPRLHTGMGGLRSDEFAAILQRGERVLNRRETADYEASRFGGSGPSIHFHGVKDMQSFQRSRTQVAADVSRAIAFSRRSA